MNKILKDYIFNLRIEADNKLRNLGWKQKMMNGQTLYVRDTGPIRDLISALIIEIEEMISAYQQLRLREALSALDSDSDAEHIIEVFKDTAEKAYKLDFEK